MPPAKKSTAKKTKNSGAAAKAIPVKASPAKKAAAAPAKAAATTLKDAPAAAAGAPVPAKSVVIPPLPPAPVNINDQQAIDAYQDLYNQLGKARWKVTDPDDIDRLQDARDQVNDILTALNKAKLEANTAAYAALLPSIKASNEKLDGIREDISTIVKDITIANTVLSAITRVLTIVTKV